ncbi:MAG: hypothetical protein SGI74_04345 [Oligoflexia bacterium]|nr:hypothetical protein [Oligoflexia bacterium]
MLYSVYTYLILVLAQVLFCSGVYAAAVVEVEKKPKTLIERNIEISKKIDEFATDIDVGLSGQNNRDVSFRNLTQVTLRSEANWAENGAFTYKPFLDLRLHLPNFEKKWQLKFSTSDEEQVRGVNKNRVRTAPSRQNYGGGVGLAQQLGQVIAEFEPRVEFLDGVRHSYILRLKTKTENSFFTIRPEAELFVRSYAGAGEFFSINTDIPLYKTAVLTIINEEQYVDRENVFSTNNGIRIGYDYNDSMSQGYSLIFESSSRPNYHLDRYVVATGFSHKIFQNILHYTIVPYLAFPRTLDFKGSPGLNLELKLIF